MQTTSEILSATVISAEKISKKYSYGGLLTGIFSRKNRTEINALKNLDLQVSKGEILGIIGTNGSGKSTLIKILSGVTTPSSGTALIDGKLFAAIEVTGSFNPDLSGLNNLKLTATIWGFSSEKIRKLLPEIIEFSELKDFINLPVKKYSSGMISRLAASLIIHSDADIILLDEVLNGSDQSFRRKMHNKILEENKKGKTFVIASHQLNDIMALCSRCIIINKGEKLFDGNPFKAIGYYREVILKNNTSKADIRFGKSENNLMLISRFDVSVNSSSIEIIISIELKIKLNKPLIAGIIINNSSDNPLAHSLTELNSDFSTKTMKCTLPASLLDKGDYFITFAAYCDEGFWFFAPRISSITINDKQGSLMPGINVEQAKWEVL